MKIVKRIIIAVCIIVFILLVCYLFYTGSRLNELNNAALEAAL